MKTEDCSTNGRNNKWSKHCQGYQERIHLNSQAVIRLGQAALRREERRHENKEARQKTSGKKTGVFREGEIISSIRKKQRIRQRNGWKKRQEDSLKKLN